MYSEKIETASNILEDDDYEREDSHALALAITLQKEGFKTYIWTNDKDFLEKIELIEQITQVKVIKALPL